MSNEITTNPLSMYSNAYKYSIFDSLVFEIRSFLGRKLLDRYPEENASRYLNLGCGSMRLVGWINADFFDLIDLLKKNNKQPDWMLDLRYPLNCPSNYWKGVYCEHTLEHLSPNQQLKLIQELYRVMIPGSTIRIIVPDLEKYVNYYTGKKSDNNFSINWPNKAESFWSLTQNWGHASVWDYKLMKKSLETAGFIKIKKVNFMVGRNRKLQNDSKNREWESLYVEADKPTNEI